MSEATAGPVVRLEDLHRWFGKKKALAGVTFEVPAGKVFGLVGENGAGKTTLMKHLLGALTPEQGRVTVFGHEPAKNPPAVLARLGYLSEDRDLPRWMRLRELMRYTQAFYPDWDQAYAERLCTEFDLDPASKVRTLSRGEAARAGLLVALAHRPELLLLDEPSSGLDAVARQDILATVVRSVAEEGRTVIFSSHLLDEVERVADEVAMIHDGQLVLHMPMDELREQHRRLVVRFAEPVSAFPDVPGALHVQGEGREWAIVCQGEPAMMRAALEKAGAEVLEETTPSLDAVFIARVRGGKGRAAA